MSHALHHLEDDPPPLVEVVEQRAPRRRVPWSLTGIALLSVAVGASVTLTALSFTLGPRPGTAILRCTGRASAITDWIASTADIEAARTDEPTSDKHLRAAAANLPEFAVGESVTLDGRQLTGRYLDTGRTFIWTAELTATGGRTTVSTITCVSD
jgi:hypothetical protein